MKALVALAVHLAAVTGLLAATGEPALADAKLLAYGKHLSQECTSCHKLDGTGTSIPPIVGLEADYFVTTMKFYQSGARDNPAMVSVAKSLDDGQLKALAIFLGTLKPAPKVAPSKKR